MRPTTFDFGGYYNNFAAKTLTVTGSGTIATGRIDNGRTNIGSLATNRTWIIVNSLTNVNLSNLKTLLENLAVSH